MQAHCISNESLGCNSNSLSNSHLLALTSINISLVLRVWAKLSVCSVLGFKIKSA